MVVRVEGLDEVIEEAREAKSGVSNLFVGQVTNASSALLTPELTDPVEI